MMTPRQTDITGDEDNPIKLPRWIRILLAIPFLVISRQFWVALYHSKAVNVVASCGALAGLMHMWFMLPSHYDDAQDSSVQVIEDGENTWRINKHASASDVLMDGMTVHHNVFRNMTPIIRMENTSHDAAYETNIVDNVFYPNNRLVFGNGTSGCKIWEENSRVLLDCW